MQFPLTKVHKRVNQHFAIQNGKNMDSEVTLDCLYSSSKVAFCSVQKILPTPFST